jgi:hypothetical protein
LYVGQQRFLSFELACRAESQLTTVAPMTTSTKIFTVTGALLLTLALGIVNGTPEQEKAFTDKYKAAMEGKDRLQWSLFFTRKAPTRRSSSFTK